MPKADRRHRARIAAGQTHSLARQRSTASLGWIDVYKLSSRFPILGAVFEWIGRILRITADTPVFAWGSNQGPGQLGVSGTTQSRTPVRVNSTWGGVPIVSLAAGSDHSLALDAEGRVWAWGRNSEGQLGDGTQETRDAPVRISVPAKCIAIAAGDAHSLAITVDGKLYAWGHNYDGQLGNGASSEGGASVTGGLSLLPVPVLAEPPPPVDTPGPDPIATTPEPLPLADVVLVAGGLRHSLAVRQNGHVMAWGNNRLGQCGQVAPPVAVTPDAPPEIYVRAMPVMRTPAIPMQARSIAAGSSISVAVWPSGEVFAWGGSSAVDLGGAPDQHVPRQVEGLTAIDAVSAQPSAGSFLALGVDGSVWRATVDEPAVRVAQLEGIEAISAGGEHALALDADGVVWGWGSNIFGQVGDGSTDTFVPEPVRVQALTLEP